MLPAKPTSVLSPFGRALQEAAAADIHAMRAELILDDEKNQKVYKSTRVIFGNVNNILFATRTGQFDSVERLVLETASTISEVLGSLGEDASQRKGNLSSAIEKFTETRLLQEFFLTGRLAPVSALQPCNDEEYLQACLGLAQELARYAVNRAVEGDIDSINTCRALCTELNGKMLEFDLRNGPLRRKYDGLKYAIKKLEEVTYELSLLQEAEPAPKRRKIDETQAPGDAGSLLDAVLFDTIRAKMDAYDKLREQVIKDSRDVQKLAKQAIFSVHRGQTGDAKSKIEAAAAAALPIMSIVADHPSLRYGSFSCSLEEWAEAAMTLEWVERERILPKAEMSALARFEITSHEYIGALSDFTGEIGRLAVAHATKRQLKDVQKIQAACLVISASMMQFNVVNGKIAKKAEAVNMTLKKVEDIVYELSMIKMGAREGREKFGDEGQTVNDAEDGS
eukprot:gene3954-4923_t